MTPLKILYLGPYRGTSRHRADAMQRLSHSVTVIDPHSFVSNSRILHKWIRETGGLFLGKIVLGGILETIGTSEFDVVWVDGGALFGPKAVLELKRRARSVINYNHDNPFVPRDKRMWRMYLQSVPEYSLLAVNRQDNVDEARRLGAAKVFLHFMPADELAHAPRIITKEDTSKWASEVSFVGTWMPERGPILAALVKQGLPLSIWGDRWQLAYEWPLLRKYWRGPGLYRDEDYAKAIQCSKVCLGLLSKGNRDQHTTRSTEIPYMGALLCAERTMEHIALYREDEEAVFWSGTQECIDKCLALLRDDGRRQRIARMGRERSVRNAALNEPTIEKILASALCGHRLYTGRDCGPGEKKK